MPLEGRDNLVTVNPQQVLQIFHSECPTVPIAETADDTFDMVGTDRADRPTVHQSAKPRVSRQEQHGALSMADRGRLCGETAQGSAG